MEEVAGWITFKTKIDKTGLKGGIKQAEKDLKELKKEEESLTKEKKKLEIDTSDYENKIEQIKKSWENWKGPKEEVQRNMNKEIAKTRQLYDGQFSRLKEINNKLDENLVKQINANNQIKKYNNEVVKKKNFEGIEKGMSSIIKKVARWSLALLGIRSIYGIIAQSVNNVMERNKELLANIDYIKFAISTAIEPVIEWLVNEIMKLLIYLGAIIKKFTGINIFSKATLNNFKATNKEAKKLNKTLAGFDEMNILSDTSGGSGGGGAGVPSLDLAGEIDKLMPDEEVEDIKNAFETIYDTARKEAVETFVGEGSVWYLAKIGAWDFIQGIVKTIHGLVDIISGIVDVIVGIFTGDFDKIGEGFKKIWQGILDVIKGIPQMIWGVIEEAIGLILGGLETLKDWAVEKIPKFFEETFPEWINKFIEWVGDKLESFRAWLQELIEKIINFCFGWLGKLIERFEDTIKKIIDRIKKFVKEDIPAVWSALVNGAKNAWEGIKTVFSKVGSFFSDTFKNAWDKIKSLFSSGGKIFDGIKEGIVDAFKTIVNTLINGINKIIKTPFNKINTLLNNIRNTEVLGAKPFKSLWNNNPLPVPQIPKLAKGGIINLPGRGVAIGGEAGREGIIPLTDEQQMQLLGESIGKYVTINLTNVTKLDSREINRKNEKVRSENTFLRNR